MFAQTSFAFENSGLLSMLITSTCQVTILIMVIWIITKLFARDRPHLAHALWILVLIKCITPPIWSSQTSPFSWLGSHWSSVVAEQSNDDSIPGHTFAEVPNVEFDVVTVRAQPYDFDGEQNATNRMTPLPVTNTVPSDSFRWESVICWIWIAGVVAGLATTFIRFAFFLRWISGCRCVDCPTARAVLTNLKNRLGVRRHIRLAVLDRPVGPAVLGVFRPTILLPAAVIAGKTEKQIEPLLAHELIHVRRGDLVWAMIQTLATRLFWFHPLVWIASRLVTRESERSCDEETIASLGCQPAVYARGLLAVLEQKQLSRNRMRVAPALPGVRPVDITSARLERVMKLGNGSLKRTPTWIWCAMFVCGALVLPGAAFVLAQETDNATKQTDLPRLHQAGEPLREVAKPEAPIPAASSRLVLEEQSVPFIANIPYVNRLFKNVSKARTSVVDTYELLVFDVTDLLQEMEKDGLGDQAAKKELLSLLPVRNPGKNGESSTPDGKEATYKFASGKVVKFGNDEPTIKIVGQAMFVLGEPNEIAAVEKTLTRFREFGFKQIVVDVKFMTVLPKDLQKLGVDWSMVDSRIGEAVANASVEPQVLDGSNPNHSENPLIKTSTEFSQPVSAVSYIEKNPLTLYTLLDDIETQHILMTVKDIVTSKTMMAPRATVFNGGTAIIRDTAMRPFVVGVKKMAEGATFFQPVIRAVESGLTVALNPVLQADASGNEFIKLKCVVKNSNVLAVETEQVPTSDGTPLQIQVPEVETTRIESSLDVRLGKTVVLSSQIKNKKGEKETLLVFMNCKVLDLNSPQADLKPVSNGNLIEPKQPKISQPLPPVPTDSPAEPEQVEDQQNETGTDDEQADQNGTKDSDVDLIVRSTKPSDNALKSRLIEFREFKIRIESNHECRWSDKSLTIKGKNIEFLSGDTDAFYVSGENAMLEISDEEAFHFRLDGEANIQFDGRKMRADNADFSLQDDNIMLQLNGNVSFAFIDTEAEPESGSSFELTADKMDFRDEAVLTSSGNVRLRYRPKGGNRFGIVQADQISLNLETGEIYIQR